LSSTSASFHTTNWSKSTSSRERARQIGPQCRFLTRLDLEKNGQDCRQVGTGT
jgi:hypothetical protein